MTASIRFNLLGPLECVIDGERVDLGGAKQQMVLAILLLEPNRVVSTERIIRWVWPGTDDDSHNGARRTSGTLQVYVSNLRRGFARLGDGSRSLIVTMKPGYVIDVGDDEVDTLEFAAHMTSADSANRAGDATRARAEYRQALALWRGELLSGLPVDVTDIGPLTHLTTERLRAMESLGDVELRLGNHGEVLTDLTDWVATNPFNEVLRGQLMLALYRCGRQVDALATYDEGRRLLVDELGLDPSPALRDLEARILRQDDDLDHTEDDQEVRSPHGRNDFEEAGSTQIRSSLLDLGAWLEMEDLRFTLDVPVVTIGRLGDRDVVVSDDRVSRYHAEVRRTGATYRIVDVGSANGTLVNGEPIGEVDLDDGDVIVVGDTSLSFHIGPLP